MSGNVLGHDPLAQKRQRTAALPATEAPQCTATTQAGNRCKRRPAAGDDRCATHRQIAVDASSAPVTPPPPTAPPAPKPPTTEGASDKQESSTRPFTKPNGTSDHHARTDSKTAGASEDRARADLDEILRAAIAGIEAPLRGSLSDQDLKTLLRRALRETSGVDPGNRSAMDLLGELSSRIVTTLPLSQVQAAASTLNPQTVFRAMESGLRLAEGFTGSINPNHLARVDDFGYDDEFANRFYPFLDFMYDSYWRCEVDGLENIPEEGRGLLVANHSGVVPWDAAMLVNAVRKAHGGKRHLRCLMLDLFATMPFLGSLFMKLGQIRACPENGLQLLSRDHLVGVFPEGLKGIGKLYSQRYKLQRFGRGGYVRLAMRANAPIIPTAVVGGEEIYPLFYRADWLARLFNFPYFPVTLTFPWLGLLGVIPLPSKWQIEFGEPILLTDYGAEDADDDLLVNDLSDRIKENMQEMLYSGLRRRQSTFLG